MPAAALEMTTMLHAACGVVCLVSGVVALLAGKARGRHPQAGRVFVWALALTYTAVLLNIVVTRNIFMLGIGWIAVCAAVEGQRALRRFQGRLQPEPLWMDYAVWGTTAALCVALGAFGILVAAGGNMLGLVCVGFAALGATLTRWAVGRWRNTPPAEEWMAVHIGMMTGAFSAALTGFLAVQFSGHIGAFEWVLWVVPTLVMTRYGARQTKIYRTRTGGSRR